jgi:hypothetical protein
MIDVDPAFAIISDSFDNCQPRWASGTLGIAETIVIHVKRSSMSGDSRY